MAFSPGLPEIILVLGVILIFFGAKKLPELAKGMGQGIKEFKKATKGVNDDLERAMDATPTYVPPPAPAAASRRCWRSNSEKTTVK